MVGGLVDDGSGRVDAMSSASVWGRLSGFDGSA